MTKSIVDLIVESEIKEAQERSERWLAENKRRGLDTAYQEKVKKLFFGERM